MDVTLYHNPDCGTSRNVLALVRQAGVTPRVIEYLHTPPSAEELLGLVARMGLSLRDILRRRGTPFAELGLDNPALGDGDLLAAIAAHPILINRPILVTPTAVRLCRPSDLAVDLLPSLPAAPFAKEDGAPFLRDQAVTGDDAALRAALMAADLPIDDLTAAGRCFFAYAGLDGAVAGYGGFECYGADALIRSVLVPSTLRRQGLGAALVPLLLARAHAAGARQAWLLTETAGDFFARLGFRPCERGSAPATILATRQAAGLCPASALLMTRKIEF